MKQFSKILINLTLKDDRDLMGKKLFLEKISFPFLMEEEIVWGNISQLLK